MTRNAWHWTSEIASSLSLESFQQNLDLLYQGFFKVVIQERDWGKLNTEVPALSFQGYTGKDSGRLRCQMGLEDQEGKEEERTHRWDPAFLCSHTLSDKDKPLGQKSRFLWRKPSGHVEPKHSASLFWVKELTVVLSSSPGMCQVAEASQARTGFQLPWLLCTKPCPPSEWMKWSHHYFCS